jgi:hypothetical protein
MLVSPPPESGASILTIEIGLTAICVALAFCLPRLGHAWFRWIEQAFGKLARKRGLSVAITGLAALSLRLAMLPLHPIPHPFYTDDFSFLFAADTFAHGRVTNPTPAMWTHFETLHITMHPTYSSMFFPAQGLVLAVGKVFFGNPWFGQLCVMALMCTALCWMLQAWLPPGWALLGGLLAVVRLGLFSYWIDTYVGGGAIAALGGALVLGALPRLTKSVRARDGLILASGIILLANSRPYEGLLLCLPVAWLLGRWCLSINDRRITSLMMRSAVAPLLLLIAAGSWMGYYNYRNFGSVLTLPYTVDRATYAVAPHFVWEKESPEPAYRHRAMRDYYMTVELPEFRKIHSPSGFLPQTLLKGTRMVLFFAGIALLPPLFMLRRVLLDRRIRFLVVCVVILTIGITLEAGVRPYYLAPFTAAIYAVFLQTMRHLRVWRPGRQPIGMTMLRLLITTCVVLAGVDLWAKPLHLRMPIAPGATWSCECDNTPQPGSDRAAMQSKLEKLAGKQLALVRYADDHDPSYEWVYNSADIDNSKVIWAREMDARSNEELIHYYKDRQVWLVEPDVAPDKLSLYPDNKQALYASR